jgi:hypothetical protein
VWLENFELRGASASEHMTADGTEIDTAEEVVARMGRSRSGLVLPDDDSGQRTVLGARVPAETRDVYRSLGKKELYS